VPPKPGRPAGTFPAAPGLFMQKILKQDESLGTLIADLPWVEAHRGSASAESMERRLEDSGDEI